MARPVSLSVLVAAVVYTSALAVAHVVLIVTGHDGDPLIDGAFQAGAALVLSMLALRHWLES